MTLFSLIKSKLSILDVVNDYTTLKKAGLYWKGNCPFHSERTASFTVSPHKEIFYCFGCHASGDLISFIERMENCSPLEATKSLAKRYQIDLPEGLGYQTQKQLIRHFEICEAIAKWCHQHLLTTQLVQQYLKKRSIDTRTATHFMLGYFPKTNKVIQSFITAMAQQQILLEDLLQSNILIRGTTLYSPFEGRLIFPIKNHLGQLCGFGGRTVKTQDTRAKYYNSKEGKHFSKRSLLFGLDLAKKKIQRKEAAFLVEGYTDCIAMVHHGFSNTVATLGTACTIEHLKLLSRYTHKVFILYDSDQAGIQAVIRLAELCWQETLELRVVQLPPGEDPASLLMKEGGDSLSIYIEKSHDIFDFFVSMLGKNFKSQSLVTKLRNTRRIISVIHTLNDPLKKDFLLQNASQVFNIPFESIKQEYKRTLASTKKNTPPLTLTPAASNNCAQFSDGKASLSISLLEKRIFCAILNNSSVLDNFTSSDLTYLLTFISKPLSDILKQLRQMQKGNNKMVSFSSFFDKLNKNEKHLVSKILLSEHYKMTNLVISQLIEQFKKIHWKMKVQIIKQGIEKAEQNSDTEQVKALVNKLLCHKKNIDKNYG